MKKFLQSTGKASEHHTPNHSSSDVHMCSYILMSVRYVWNAWAHLIRSPIIYFSIYTFELKLSLQVCTNNLCFCFLFLFLSNAKHNTQLYIPLLSLEQPLFISLVGYFWQAGRPSYVDLSFMKWNVCSYTTFVFVNGYMPTSPQVHKSTKVHKFIYLLCLFECIVASLLQSHACPSWTLTCANFWVSVCVRVCVQLIRSSRLYNSH